MSETVLIMAGGTGGHVFPALAVAHEMQAAGYRVLWLGAENGMETRLVPQYGFEVAVLGAGRVRGGGWKRKILGPLQLLRAVWQARRLIRQERPVLAVGFGGFVSAPGGLAAKFAGVPLVIHEQNAVPGLTNRLLGRFAAETLLGFEGAMAGGVWVGNPVRTEIAQLAEPQERYGARRGPLRVLVLGGSQGALVLNQDLPELLLAALGSHLEVRHQCGAGREDEAVPVYRALGLPAEVSEFIDDMAQAYAWADLVVCRAGALTVAEVAVAGVAALFVPLPSAVDDHQTLNAGWLVERGAALMLAQNEMNAGALARSLAGMTERDALAQIAQRARQLAVTDSARRVARICQEVADGQ